MAKLGSIITWNPTLDDALTPQEFDLILIVNEIGVAISGANLAASIAGPGTSPTPPVDLGLPAAILAAIHAWIYQDADAHDTCSLTACLNPLHPGPCKGWKGTLFDTAPGAFHAIEGAKAEKANAVRIKKIEALKAKGLPIPHKLLQPIVAKSHPHEGQTAKAATGEAHAAGKAITEANGIKVSHPGKVTLGEAVKSMGPVAKGPKGKKPTLGSKGIAFVIAQEKVTPQYKLDKAAAITPEQWDALSAEDKATVRTELGKIEKDGFGPQQKKATELLDKFNAKPAPAKPEPKTVTTPSGQKIQDVSPAPAPKLGDKTTPPTAADKAALLDKIKAAQAAEGKPKITEMTEVPKDSADVPNSQHALAYKNLGSAIFTHLGAGADLKKIAGAYAKMKAAGKLEDQPGFKATVDALAQHALKTATQDKMPGLGHGKNEVGITEFNHEIRDHIAQGKPGLPPLVQKMVDNHKSVQAGKGPIGSDAEKAADKAKADAAVSKVVQAHEDAGAPKVTEAKEVGPPAATAPHHTPKTPGQPLSAKNYTPAMKDATDAAGNYVSPPKLHALQMSFDDRFKAYGKINVEEWKALPEGTKTAIVKDMIDAAAGDKQLHQGFIGEDGKAYTPVSAWMARRNIQLPALDQSKIDKFVPQFAKGKPTKPTPVAHIAEKTTVEAKNIFGEYSNVLKVNHPKYGGDAAEPETPPAATPKLADAIAKPKALPKHVTDAITMAKGQAPGASWSKNHLAAYQHLSADEYHALPPDIQDKIAAELTKAQSKFLDPKKVAAAAALLEKFQGKKPKVPDAPPVALASHLHDHSISDAQAKKAAADASVKDLFQVAKHTAGVTSLENPDATGLHTSDAEAAALLAVKQKTALYDDSVLKTPAVQEASDALHTAILKQAYAENVKDAKAKAFNKVAMKATSTEISPMEKAALKAYGAHLLNHNAPPTSAADIDKLKADTKQAETKLIDEIHGGVKKANAPKPEDMSGAQLDDRAAELMGPGAAHADLNLSLADMQAAKKEGQKQFAELAAQKGWPTESTDPAVAAKIAKITSILTQLDASKRMEGKLGQHFTDHHAKTLLSGTDVNGHKLTDDDKKVLSLHTQKMLDDSAHIGSTIEKQKTSLAAAESELSAAASKAAQPAAKPEPLSAFDQKTISNEFSAAWGKHAYNALNYGVKTFDAQKLVKNNPEYPAFTQNLTDLRALAGQVALAHAEREQAKLAVPDLENGAPDHASPEWEAWLSKMDAAHDLDAKFNALHKQAQTRLDKIRTEAGLKKRALPKLDSAAVKATAAEGGYYKSGTYGAPNYGKLTSAKQYMKAKVGDQLGVAHQTAGEKKTEKLKAMLDNEPGGSASTSKIENKTEPVKLGSDSSIADIPTALQKQITNDFKSAPKGKYLADPTEDIFGNLVNLAAAHGKTIPGGMSVDQVLKSIDEQHSKNLGVANTGMLHKKVTDWLSTTGGAEYAQAHSKPNAKTVKQLTGELELPKGVTLAPGEKVQKVAGPGAFDTSLSDKDFHKPSSSQAQTVQDAYMKAQGVKWTQQQKSSIKAYTGAYSTAYNDYLRDNSAGSNDTKQAVIDIQAAMMPLPQNTLLKRGTDFISLPEGFRSAEGAKKLVGKTFEEPGFSSTTVAGEGGHFSGKPLQLVIEAPKGSGAAFVNGISHFKGTENEMLLAAGTKFKVISVEQVHGQTVMRVRIVGDK